MALPPIENPRIKQLVADAETSRQRLGIATRSLGKSLNFPVRLRASIKENMSIWSGAAVIVSVVVAGLIFRPKRVVVERHLFGGQPTDSGKASKNSKNSMLIAAAGLLFQVARPLLQKMLTERLSVWADPQGPGGTKRRK